MIRQVIVGITLFLAGCCTSLDMAAQMVTLNSPKRLRPELTLGSLSLTASPSSVNIALVPNGQTVVSSAITINNVLSLTVLGTFSLWGYFSTTSALTSTAGDVIPSSAIFAKCTNSSQGSYASFTQGGPFGVGSSLLIYQTSSLATLLLNESQTCSLMIDLSSLKQLPAGSYTGTLFIQAQAL